VNPSIGQQTVAAGPEFYAVNDSFDIELTTSGLSALDAGQLLSVLLGVF
jgi:hypothetical protein